MKRNRITIICSLLCLAAFVLSIAFSAMSNVVLAMEDWEYGETVQNPNFDQLTGQMTNLASQAEADRDAYSQQQQPSFDMNQDVSGTLMEGLASPTTQQAGTQQPVQALDALEYIDGGALLQDQVKVDIFGDTQVLTGTSTRIVLNLDTSSMGNNAYYKDVRVLIKLPEGVASIDSTPFGKADDPLIPDWLNLPENRPFVEMSQDRQYAVFVLPYVFNWAPSGSSATKREFYFDYKPFPNGITANDTAVTLTPVVQQYLNGSYAEVPISSQYKNAATQKAASRFAWKNVGSAVTNAAQTAAYNVAETWTFTTSKPVFTVSTGALYSSPFTADKGTVFAKRIELTETITMPAGLTLTAASLTASGSGIVVVAEDGKSATITWTIDNTNPPSANIADVSRTVTLNSVQVDNTLFPQGTSGAIIKGSITGKAYPYAGEPAAGLDLSSASSEITLSRGTYVPQPEDWTLSRKLAKSNMGSSTISYSETATFRLYNFGNFQSESGKKLANFMISDTWTDNALDFKNFTTGVYEGYPAGGTFKVQYTTSANTSLWTDWPGATAVSYATSRTLNVSELTLGTGVKVRGVRLVFGEVDKGFRVLGNPTSKTHESIGNAPSITFGASKETGVNQKTFTNTGRLDYTDGGNTARYLTATDNVTFKRDDVPTVGNSKFARNVTEDSANNGSATAFAPADTVEYSILIINEGTVTWKNPRVVDTMSSSVDMLSYRFISAKVYDYITAPPKTGDVLNLSGCTPAEDQLNWESGSEPTPPASGTVVDYKLLGEVKEKQCLVITYQVKIKPQDQLGFAGTTNSIDIKNTFKTYHRWGTGGGGDEIGIGGTDGSRTVTVLDSVPQVDVRKHASSDGSKWSQSVTVTASQAEMQFRLFADYVDDSTTTFKDELYFLIGDSMPVGFHYKPGSATLSKNGATAAALADSSGADFNKPGNNNTVGDLVLWNLGAARRGDKFVLTYTATLDSEVLSAKIGTNTSQLYSNCVGLYVYADQGGPNGRGKPVENYVYPSGSRPDFYPASRESDGVAPNGNANWDNIGANAYSITRLTSYAYVTVNSTQKYLSITKGVFNAAGSSVISSANVGDTVTYRISVRNESATGVSLNQSVMVDIIPKGMEYVEGSMRYNTATSNANPTGTAGFTAPVATPLSDDRTKLTVIHSPEVTLASNQYANYAFQCKVTEAVFPNKLDSSTNVTNYAGVFQKAADNVTARISGTKVTDGSDVHGANWHPDPESGPFDRFYNSAGLKVERTSIVPGIQKKAYYINKPGNTNDEKEWLWQPLTGNQKLTPGSVIGWEIVVANGLAAGQSIDKPYVVDALPPGVSYDKGYPTRIHTYNMTSGAVSDDGVPIADATLITAHPAMDFKRIGWELDKTIAPNTAYAIRFYTSVYVDFAGEALNGAYLVPSEIIYDGRAIDANWGEIRRSQEDAAWPDGAAKDAVYAQTAVSIYSQVGATGSKLLKVADKETGATLGPVKNADIISCFQGSTATFDLVIQNNGDRQFGGLVLIDKLPDKDDYGVVTNMIPRGSEWRLSLKSGFSTNDFTAFTGTGAVSDTGTPVSLNGAKLSFRKLVGTEQLYKDTDWNAGAAAAGWSPTYDPSQHNAFRLELPGTFTLSTGSWLVVRFSATVPSGASANGVAWNSFGFGLKHGIGTDQSNWSLSSPIEPLKVGISTDNLQFTKKTIGGEKDGGAGMFMAPLEGGYVDFALTDIRNPSENAQTLKLTDIPNYGHGGLELYSIDMPRFALPGGGATGVQYSISAKLSDGRTLSNGKTYSADADRQISASELLMGKNSDNSYVTGDAYITELAVDFGKVPGGFGNAAGSRIRLRFSVVNKPAGVYDAAHAGGGAQVPQDVGSNSATLTAGNTSHTDSDDYGVTRGFAVSIKKHTLTQTGALASDATETDPATGVAENIASRKMWVDGDGVLNTAFAINGEVRNDSGNTATLLLTDHPGILPDALIPKAGLAPTKIVLPNFVNYDSNTFISAYVRYAGDAGYTYYGEQLRPWDFAANKTITINAARLVDSIYLRFVNAPAGFAQDGDILMYFKYMGDVALMEPVAEAGGWSRVMNYVKFENWAVSHESPEDSDFATFNGTENIAIEKSNEYTGDGIKTNYGPGDDAKFELFNVANALSTSANNFIFYDIPEKTLTLKSVRLPAFEFASGVSYTVSAYTGGADLGALPRGGLNSGFKWDAADRAKIDNWLKSPGWTVAGSGGAGLASADIPLGAGAKAFKVVFNTVPAGFKQASVSTSVNPMGMAPVVVTCGISSDLSGYRNDGNGMYFADNDATLLYDGITAIDGLGAQDGAEIKIVVNAAPPTIDKTTADANDTKVTAAKDDVTEKKMTDRELREVSGALTGTFIIDGAVKNTAGIDNVMLTLTDEPEVVASSGEVKAGLVPTRLVVPAFRNAGDATYSVQYKLYGDAAEYYASASGTGQAKDIAASMQQTITFPNVSASQYVSKIILTFPSVPKDFAQSSGILATFVLRGDTDYMNLETAKTGWTNNWRCLGNTVTLRQEATGIQAQETEPASDIVTLRTAENISVSKKAAGAQAEYGKPLYEGGDKATFELGEIRNGYGGVAANFRFFDIPDANLTPLTLDMPAFTSGADVTYRVYAFTGTGTIPAYASHGAKTGGAFTPAELSAVEGWLGTGSGGGWTQVGDTAGYPADVARNGISLEVAGQTARAVKVEFGNVPKGFEPANDAVAKIAVEIAQDVSVYQVGDKYTAGNDVALLYNGVGTLSATDSDEIGMTPYDITVAVDKHAADRNGAKTAAKSEKHSESPYPAQTAAQVTGRAVYEEGSKNYAKFLLEGVESQAPFTSTLTLSDYPQVFAASGSAVAALIPAEFKMPAFENAKKVDGSPVSYTVEAMKYNENTFTSVQTVSDASQPATVSFGSVGPVKEIRITFADVEKGFKQNTPIVATFELYTNGTEGMNALESIANNPGWSRIWNAAQLTLECGALDAKITSDKANDYVSICVKEEIAIQKNLAAAAQEKPLEAGDIAEFEITNVANALPGTEAQGFTLYDVVQKDTLALESASFPAFEKGSGIGYDVYVTYNDVPGGVSGPRSDLKLTGASLTAAEKTALTNWLSSGWTKVNTAALDAAAPHSVTLPKQAGKAPAAFKAVFGTVPVGFGPVGGAGVGVGCRIGDDFTAYTKVSEGKYTARNMAALLYDGPVNPLGAWDDATVSVEDADFNVKVTKETDTARLPGKATVFGGIAVFNIGGVKNYAEGRPAALSIVDTPDTGLHLSKLIVPTFKNNNNDDALWTPSAGNGVTRYTVYAQYEPNGKWQPLPGGENLKSSESQTINVDFAKHVYAFKIEFGDVDLPYTNSAGETVSQKVVPRGFEFLNPNDTIIAEFYVDDSASMFTNTPDGYRAQNKVVLTNEYRAKAKSASASDYVLVKEPDSELKKTAQQEAVMVGTSASFQIAGIGNFLNTEATNFRFTDTPGKGLYLQQMAVPDFIAPDGDFSTTYSVTAKTSNGGNITLAGEDKGTVCRTNVRNVIVVPEDYQTLAKHVTEFTVSFSGKIPAGFKCSGVVTTTFLADPDIAVHAPSYTEPNTVALYANNQVKQSQDSVKVFDKVDVDVKKTASNRLLVAGDDAVFTIDNVENKLIVDADDFYLLDVPDEALSLKSIVMPTFANAGSVKYSIYAKLNSNSDAAPWTAIRRNLDAKQTYNIVLDITGSDRVAALWIDFGTVPAGFKNTAPIRTTFTTSKDMSVYDDRYDDLALNAVLLSYSKYGNSFSAIDSDYVRVYQAQITKTADNTTAVRGQTVTYTVSSFANTTGRALTNFAIDDIPSRGIDFRRVELPAFTNGSGVRYSVAYTTNYNSSFRLMATNLDAAQAQTVSRPQLTDGEVVTLVRVLFDRVPAGFGLNNTIKFVFVVTADPALTQTQTIGNELRYSFDPDDPTPYGPITPPIYNYYSYSTTTGTSSSTSSDVPYGSVQTPEDQVPYAPVKVKNPMAVTGEDGMAPMYWILVAIALVIGAGLVAFSGAPTPKYGKH